MIHFEDNDVSNYDLMSSLVATQDTRDRLHHNSIQILKPLEKVIRQNNLELMIVIRKKKVMKIQDDRGRVKWINTDM